MLMHNKNFRHYNELMGGKAKAVKETKVIEVNSKPRIRVSKNSKIHNPPST